jgi:hypothetical protein
MTEYKGRFRKGAYIVDHRCSDSSKYSVGETFEQRRGNFFRRCRVFDIENVHHVIIVPIDGYRLKEEFVNISGYSLYKPWDMYSFGYKFAAETLKERIDMNNIPWPVVFPCSFLYLHSIELIIKGLILQGNIALEIPYSSKDFETNHNIQDHWNKAKEILAKLWPGTDPSDLEVINKSIQKIDADVYELMRYPIHGNGVIKDIPAPILIERGVLPILHKLTEDLESLDTAIHEEKINK